MCLRSQQTNRNQAFHCFDRLLRTDRNRWNVKSRDWFQISIAFPNSLSRIHKKKNHPEICYATRMFNNSSNSNSKIFPSNDVKYCREYLVFDFGPGTVLRVIDVTKCAPQCTCTALRVSAVGFYYRFGYLFFFPPRFLDRVQHCLERSLYISSSRPVAAAAVGKTLV